ncbi:MAG: DUF1232 domain-containing protein [Cyclobacteriaceae bacterium]
MTKEEIWNRAKRASADKTRLGEIISQAKEKLDYALGNSDKLKGLSTKIQVLIRMIKAHLSGRYTAFSTRTILLITFALLYFIIPTDAIPDFLPIIGFTDDISILYFVWKQINSDVSKFLKWEQLD